MKRVTVRAIIGRRLLLHFSSIPEERRVKKKVCFVFGVTSKSFIESTKKEPFESLLHKEFSKHGLIAADDQNWFWDYPLDSQFQHNAKNVGCCTLRLPQLTDKAYFKNLVALANNNLPSYVRLFSCMEVGKSLRPHEAISWREYELLMPPSALRLEMNKDVPFRDVLKQINEQLQKFVGSHWNDNFQKKAANAKRTSDSSGDLYYDDWRSDEKKLEFKVRNSVYHAHAELVTIHGNKKVRFTFRGDTINNFQVRTMAGTAIAVACGVLPSHLIELARELPFKIPLPMVPLAAVIQTDCGMAAMRFGQRVSADYYRGSEVLQDSDSVNVATKFKEDSLYWQVIKQWEHQKLHMVTVWKKYLSEFAPSAEVRDEWLQLFTVQRRLHLDGIREKQGKELALMLEYVERFKQKEMEMLAERENAEDQFGVDFRVVPDSEKFTHHVFLWPGLATEIAVRFQTVPCKVVSQAGIALAIKIVSGEVQAQYTRSYCVDCIERWVRKNKAARAALSSLVLGVVKKSRSRVALADTTETVEDPQEEVVGKEVRPEDEPLTLSDLEEWVRVQPLKHPLIRPAKFQGFP